jgi:MFS family permease
MEESHHLQSPFKMTLYAHSLCFMGFVIGYQFGTFNTFFSPFADSILKITDPEERSLIASNLNFSLLLGVFLNSFIGGNLIESFGRYKILLYTTFATCLAGVIYMVPNIYTMYLARFILGICGGFGMNLSQIIYKEILPYEMGNKMGNMFYIYHTLGIMIPFAFGSPVAAEYWRLIFFLPMLVEIPKLILYMTVLKYESPNWIVKNSENPEMAILKQFADIYNYDYANTKAAKFLEAYHADQAKSVNVVTFRSLFSKNYIRPFFLCIFVCVSNQTCGIAYLVYYSRSIYEAIGFQNTTVLTFFMGFMNFSAGIFITTFSARISKRQNLYIGATCAGLSYFIMLLGMIYHVPLLVIIGSYCFVFFFGMGLGGSMFPYLADAVPPIGLSYASSFVWLLNCVNAKFGLAIINSMEISSLFYIFMMLTLLAGLVISLFSVETRNKSTEEIQRDFLKIDILKF